jgi:hypothetical protein
MLADPSPINIIIGDLILDGEGGPSGSRFKDSGFEGDKGPKSRFSM